MILGPLAVHSKPDIDQVMFTMGQIDFCNVMLEKYNEIIKRLDMTNPFNELPDRKDIKVVKKPKIIKAPRSNFASFMKSKSDLNEDKINGSEELMKCIVQTNRDNEMKESINYSLDKIKNLTLEATSECERLSKMIFSNEKDKVFEYLNTIDSSTIEEVISVIIDCIE